MLRVMGTSFNFRRFVIIIIILKFCFNTGSNTPNDGDYMIIINDLVEYTVGSALNSRQNIMDIPINDDAIVEGTESFTVTLSAVAGAGNPQVNPLLSVATVFIIDNDGEYNQEIKNKGKNSICKSRLNARIKILLLYICSQPMCSQLL